MAHQFKLDKARLRKLIYCDLISSNMQRVFCLIDRKNLILSNFILYKSIFANRTKQALLMLEINCKTDPFFNHRFNTHN